MLSARKLGGAVAAAGTAAALMATAGSAAARQVSHAAGQGGAGADVFVQTDNLAGNAIAVYDRGRRQNLTAGGDVCDPAGRAGNSPDRWSITSGRGGSLRYDAAASRLFAGDQLAGSNTVSVFEVHGDRLQLHRVISSGQGVPRRRSPVHGDLVYVLNAQRRRLDPGLSVAGRRWSWFQVVPTRSAPLGLNRSATPQFVNTPGDIAFSPNGQQLLVTTKANTNAIDVFAIGSSGRPSATPVVNTEAGDVPFAVAVHRLRSG